MNTIARTLCIIIVSIVMAVLGAKPLIAREHRQQQQRQQHHERTTATEGRLDNTQLWERVQVEQNHERQRQERSHSTSSGAFRVGKDSPTPRTDGWDSGY